MAGQFEHFKLISSWVTLLPDSINVPSTFFFFFFVPGVFILTAIANRFRLKPVNLQEQFIMAYGGLRGAVSFSLVEMLLPSVIHPRQMFVTTTLAVILFTVFIQVKLSFTIPINQRWEIINLLGLLNSGRDHQAICPASTHPKRQQDSQIPNEWNERDGLYFLPFQFNFHSDLF